MFRKSLTFEQCEVKLEGDMGRFEGYCSSFGGVDSYGDTIVKGAYEYTLRTHGKPAMFFNHDMESVPLGRWTKMVEDDHGLYGVGEITVGTSLGRDVYEAMKAQTVSGLSIGFYMKPSDYEVLDGGGRLIKRVSNLVEVSVVTFPADNAARVDLESVKSEYGETLEGIETIKDLERFLRDAGGFSKGAALALVARAKTILGRSDSGAMDADANAVRLLAERFRVMGERLPL